jgi:cell division protein FtsA
VGIDIAGVVYSGLASSNAVLSETEKELGVVAIDIGAGTTDIAIWVDGALSYSSVLPVGARNVTNDIAVGLRVSLESAEKIKLLLSKISKPKFAFSPEDSEVKPKESDELDLSELELPEEVRKISRKTLVDGIIKDRLREIFDFVGIEIQKSGFIGMTPSGVVITGGGALTVAALEACRQRLAMPCRIGAPFTFAETKLTGLIDELNSPQFATAVGLVLYGTEEHQVYSKVKSQSRGQGSLPKVPAFGKMAEKLPIAGIFEKLSKLLKSFLP